MKSILIIGQGPSKAGVGKKPLDGNGSGQKLAKLSGITRDQLFEMADAINLLDDWHGKNGKGDKFPIELARKRAEAIVDTWWTYKQVVLLGENVAAAFFLDLKPLEIGTLESNDRRIRVAMIPHPSGVNRWYNDKENFAAASNFLAGLFHPEEGGVAVSKSRAERAEYCTKWLQEYDRRMNWADFAEMLIEVERDRLYLEVGAKSWDEWAERNAPSSHAQCYIIKARHKALKAHLSMEIMRQIPAETAQWASNPKNISPAALKRPEVQKALINNPKRKAIAAVKQAAPDEHVESTHNLLLKFPLSLYEEFKDSYMAFRALKDESASREDFVEFLAAEYKESKLSNGQTIRERWEEIKGAIVDQEKTQDGGANVAAV